MTSTTDDLARLAIALLDGRVLGAPTRAAMLAPQVRITARAQFGPGSETSDGEEARRVGLAYGMGWGLLIRTAHGPAFIEEGHGDGARTHLLCLASQRSCLILLANSDNGDLAYRSLVDALLGADEVPSTWEGDTPAQIRETQAREASERAPAQRP